MMMNWGNNNDKKKKTKSVVEPWQSPEHRASLKSLGRSLLLRCSIEQQETLRNVILMEEEEEANFLDRYNNREEMDASDSQQQQQQRQQHQRCMVPTFRQEEVEVGKLLARGGFNVIFELKSITLLEVNSHSGNDDDQNDNKKGVTSNNKNEQGRIDFANKVNHHQHHRDDDDDSHCRDPEEEQGEDGSSFSSASHSHDDSGNYVVKFLSSDLNLGRLERGARDVVQEAKLLSNLQHDNIIALRGLANDGTAGFAQGPAGFFLILDRLEETLLQRMDRLKKRPPKQRSFHHHHKKHYMMYQMMNPLRKLFFPTRTKVKDETTTTTTSQCHCRDSTTTSIESSLPCCFQERLEMLVELTRPLKYLHSQQLNIVYRDLKPENIGFTKDNTLKLFDFGLALELQSHWRVMDDDNNNPTKTMLYHVGSFGGTHPYVAPEIALGKPYGVSADVYSFAIIFYEVLAMREPFQHLMQHEYVDRVVYGGERPKFPKHKKKCSSATATTTSGWSLELKELISQCWDPDPFVRPSMETVYARLKAL